MLSRIKADPRLRIIPVIVLTTSSREEDVIQTYQAGANTYIPKPAEYAGYREVVSALRTYWLDTALKVPHPAAPATLIQRLVRSFNPTKSRTCRAMAISVGSRSIELAP